MSLVVRVISPDQTVWDNAAEEVILPSTTGQLGILPGHAPLLTALDTGVMRVRVNKDWLPIALMGGFAEVEDNEVTVLVNGAERGDAIDRAAAQSEYSNAELGITQADSPQAKIKAAQSLKRARARLLAAGGTV